MKRLSAQAGYLTLVAVMLIVLFGFLGTVMAYLFLGNANANQAFLQSENAFLIAEAGLEKATRRLLIPLLSGINTRTSCAALAGNSAVTNSAFNTGTFTVTPVAGSPFYATTLLSAAIAANSTTIPVVSVSGLAAYGRILVDREAIDYAALSGNNLIGVTRGANGSLASAHAASAPVAQYQCSIDSQGGTPNLTSPLYKRELQEGIQLQVAWAVGARRGNQFTLADWNQSNELQWTNQSYTNGARQNLNGLSLLSPAEGWAVGNANGANLTLLHLTPSGWASTSLSGCSGQNLLGASAVSSKEAWAVGTTYRGTSCAGNYRYSILYWNGSSWAKLSSTTTPSIPADGTTSASTPNLNAIHVIDTTGNGLGNFGFAVGDSGKILNYNGTAWTAMTSPTTQNLSSVFVVSSTESWAVGASGVILKFNGSNWSAVSSPTATALNAIFMLDSNGDGIAEAGWAVGNSGVAITYNGSTWSSQNPGGTNLFAVAAFNSSDVWAVGANGRVAHWDGTGWTNFTSNVSAQLNDIDLVAPGARPFSAWREVFP